MHNDGDGTLRQLPPSEVFEQLRAQGVDADDLLLSVRTDIGLEGHYRDHWLAVTPERLLVMSDGADPELQIALELKKASEYRIQSGIGSGLLQARINGTYVDLLRFSNRHAYSFEKVARKLDRAIHGDSIVVTPEEGVDPRRCRSCGLMLEFGGDSCPQCVSRGAVLMRMWKLMRPYRLSAVVMMALLLLGIALDLVSPQLTRYLVDHVLPGSAAEAQVINAEPSRMAEHLNMLLTVVLVLAGVQVMRMGVNLINGRLGSKIGTAITYDMRGRLVGHMQQLSVGFYDKQQVGSLVGRVAYDTEALHGFINQLTSGFLLQVLMLVGVGVMMFVIDPKLALFTLIPAPLVVGGTIVFWRYVYPRNYRAWDASSKQAGMLSGLLSGVRVVKAFSQEQREMDRFNAVSGHLRHTRRDVETAMNTFNPIMGLVFQLGGWIVWYVGGRDVLEYRLTLGELMAFFGYLWMFYGPLGTLPQFTNWLTSFATQAHRIFEILDTPVQISDPQRPVHLRPMKGHVKFEDVSFGYNRHSPVLRGLNLEIKPGEMIGVVGQSGSGKTTLVNLICRFYDVNEGRVLVDGHDVRDIPKDELRSQVGVVLQEPFLFRGSIWENLAYGKPDAQPDEVISAAKSANCHDFILRQPHAYDTWVGERGAGLSGGERQRIGIARVLLTDPRILILDEATSSVDAESEAAIQAALAEVVRGRTTIAIAHRLSTLRNAHRVVVIDNGRIIEEGTPAELMARDGQFARMVRLQQGVHAQAGIDELYSLTATQHNGSSLGHRSCDLTERQCDDDGDHDHANADADAHAGGAQHNVLPPLRGHRTRWLEPEIARVHLGNHDALHVTVLNEGLYGGVFALRCFPVHYPHQYISLRYADSSGHEVEIGIIRDLESWPTEAQQLIEASLQKRYFVHTILSIDRIEAVNNYLNFSVETDLGPQRFTLRWQADRAYDYGVHGKMLLDTDENRFLIPDVRALPERERRLLLRYIYW